MSYPGPHTDPLHTAERAIEISRKAGKDGVAFQRVTMVCLGLTAAATMIHALRPLLRDVIRGIQMEERHREHGSGRG